MEIPLVKFALGDEVVVFQDTKSRIGTNFGRGVIVNLDTLEEVNDERIKVRFNSRNNFILWVHPEDMRLLTKLERALK